MPLDDSHARLIAIARATPWFMRALEAVRMLGLSDWCIGAGAVRNMVWDALHERPQPSHLPDVDVAWFDASDTTPERDAALLARLRAIDATTPWEVVNQAGVHRWFERCFGHA